MQSLKIILLCIVSAVIYGICHDQVTARVCVEYFTVGHAHIFNTTSPTLLAFGWGTLATWWVGLILGILAAVVCRIGSWPKFQASHLIRPIACLLIVTAVTSLLAGITGYKLAQSSGFVLPEPLGPRVPEDRHALFFADSLAHLAAYVVGALGGLILCVRVLIQRRRVARADESGRVDLPVVVLSRWTARTISIPIFGLVFVLVHGNGVPNPFTASLHKNLLGTAVLLLFVGSIVAWKWEGIGGLLIIGGLVLFAIVAQGILLNIVLWPWMVMGLLYLVCWLVEAIKVSETFRRKY
ncbi:MAG: hypothetical protein JXM70_17665 [Pirellulales bacterium]|nr:hypothetical protein [Pirellulales bacterium]